MFLFVSCITSGVESERFSESNYVNNAKLKITKIAENVYQHISYKRVEPWGLVGASGLIVVDDKDAYLW